MNGYKISDHKWRPTYQVAKPDGRARVEFCFPDMPVNVPLRGIVR